MTQSNKRQREENIKEVKQENKKQESWDEKY